jgi:hypothetical protein
MNDESDSPLLIRASPNRSRISSRAMKKGINDHSESAIMARSIFQCRMTPWIGFSNARRTNTS